MDHSDKDAYELRHYLLGTGCDTDDLADAVLRLCQIVDEQKAEIERLWQRVNAEATP